MIVRILSALVGIVIGVSILLIDNFWLYLAAISFFSAVGVWELTRAVKCEKHKLMRWVCIVFSALLPSALSVQSVREYSAALYCLLLLVLFAIMLKYHSSLSFSSLAMCGGGAVVIPTALSCIVLVRFSTDDRSLGVFLVIYMLFCAWFGDSGAYFAGTFFGKHKLCPTISPKKTIEGFVGGIVTVGVMVTLECIVYNLFFADGAEVSYAVLIPVGMAASVIGVLGDLSASVIKRQYEVKDFGNIMPGHGGVLDRFDSVIFVAPFLFAVFKFLQPI